MTIQRKRVAKRLASGLLAGALALGGLAISGGSVSAKTPSSPSTNRIAGSDRYETAVEIAIDQLGGGAPTGGLVIASGDSAADALAAASLTTDTRPMLLVRKDSVPQAVADFLADHRVAMSATTPSPTVYVVGGESAVSKEVFDAIKAAVTIASDTTPPTVTRRDGADRYATAKAVADTSLITDATDTMIIVNGENGKWADALSAGPIASENEWPIILTNASGLETSAKAAVDAYLAKIGSVKKFLIIGGPAVVSTGVEDYLVGTKLVPVKNITRIAGIDRYQTNFLVNVSGIVGSGSLVGVGYGLLEGAPSFNVALASGQAPWDALTAASWVAKKGIHLVLTPTAGGSPFAAGVAAAGAGTAEEYDSTYGGIFGNVLYILGGRSAVSDAARAGYLGAATSSDLTATSLTGCVTNSKSLTLTLSGELTDLEYGRTSQSAAPGVWKLNGAALTAGNVTVSAVNLPGGPENQILSVSLHSPLALNSVLQFAGWTEGATISANYQAQRNIGSVSCTVANDVTRPVITLRAISGSVDGDTSASAKILLSSTKPVTLLGPTGKVSIGAITVGSASNATAAAVTPLDSSGKQYLITLDSTESLTPTWATLVGTPSLVSVSTAAIVDAINGLNPLSAEAYGELDTTTVNTPTVAGVTCTSTSNTLLTAGNLHVTANDKSTKGAKGSLYKLSVVNQRGINLPTVAVDTTAQTITVTADIGYHSTSDVAQVMVNTYGNGLDPANDLWTVSASASGATALSATLAPVTSTSLGSSAGTSTCSVLLTNTEPFFLASTGAAVALNGLSSAYFAVTGAGPVEVIFDPADASNGAGLAGTGYSRILTFVTPYMGTGTISFTANNSGLIDLNGNRFLSTVAITAS